MRRADPQSCSSMATISLRSDAVSALLVVCPETARKTHSLLSRHSLGDGGAVAAWCTPAARERLAPLAGQTPLGERTVELASRRLGRLEPRRSGTQRLERPTLAGDPQE